MTKREAKRLYRELTPDERTRVTAAREQIDREEKGEILELAKRFRTARRSGAAALDEALQVLKAERESQGLSLGEIEQRTGIAKSNLSRLENDEHVNPTIATLSNYADALGKKLVIALADK